MNAEHDEIRDAVHALVDAYRSQCLWYLAEDYYPSSLHEFERILDAIQRHGDVAGFQRAAKLKACLSPTSSEESAVS